METFFPGTRKGKIHQDFTLQEANNFRNKLPPVTVSDSSHRKVLVMLGFASQLNLESTTYLGSPYQRQCMCSEV